MHKKQILSFDVSIALAVGVDAALVYNYILEKTKANDGKSDTQFIEGRVWFYKTQKEMADYFLVLNDQKIKRAISKLTQQGLIAKRSFNTSKFDRSCCYSINDF